VPRFTHIAGCHAGIAVLNALIVPFSKTDSGQKRWSPAAA